MLRKLVLVLLLFTLTGCDVLQLALNAKSGQLTFKWASVDRQRLAALVAKNLPNNTDNNSLKIAENAVNAIITAYAKQQGYQLIVANGEQNIAYNQKQKMQDVTEDVLGFMSKNSLSPSTTLAKPTQ